MQIWAVHSKFQQCTHRDPPRACLGGCLLSDVCSEYSVQPWKHAFSFFACGSDDQSWWWMFQEAKEFTQWSPKQFLYLLSYTFTKYVSTLYTTKQFVIPTYLHRVLRCLLSKMCRWTWHMTWHYTIENKSSMNISLPLQARRFPRLSRHGPAVLRNKLTTRLSHYRLVGAQSSTFAERMGKTLLSPIVIQRTQPPLENDILRFSGQTTTGRHVGNKICTNKNLPAAFWSSD